jgi:hypothetical protein
MAPQKHSRTGFLKTALMAVLSLVFGVGLLGAVQLPGDVRIYEVKGQPIEIILKDGSTPPLRVGQSVPHDATIRTSATATITLIFSNGAMLAIQPGSELQVNFLTSEPTRPALPAKPANSHSSAATDTDVKLKKGLIMLDVPPQNKKSNFQVTTPLGLACIRGTRFFVQVGKNLALVGVVEGKVLANSLAGDSKMVLPGTTVAMTPAGFIEPGGAGATLLNQTLNFLQNLLPAVHNINSATPNPPSSRASYKVSE